jgi:RNA polymerase sigma factor (sigma-70 family)
VLDPGDSDSESFGAFFRESKRQVNGLAFMLTGDSSSAQDIAQEAYLRAWVRWPRIRKFDDPAGWTCHVLYNLGISKSRGDRLRRRTAEGVTSVPGPNEEHLILAGALRSLPEEQMRVLVLHDGAGIPIRELATQMQIPEGTIKSRLSRGRAAAAAALFSPQSHSKEGHASR